MQVVIQVESSAVLSAFNQLLQAQQDLTPIMRKIGEDMLARTKQRFETGTDPAGNKWKPNAQATIEGHVASRHGYGKSGKITSRGAGYAINKRPLIATRDLSRQWFLQSDTESVTLASSRTFGSSGASPAIHQFGGQAGRGRKVNIPARPFLPITATGELYPVEESDILNTLNAYFRAAWGEN